MWSIEEVNRKKQDVIKRMKVCEDLDEWEKMSLSLASYISILDNSGTFWYTKFYNLMDSVTRGRFTLLKPSTKLVVKGGEVAMKNKDYMDFEYLEFLMQLSHNVSCVDINVDNEDDIALGNFNLSDDELIDISKLFYSRIGDKKIYDLSRKILDDSTALNFSFCYTSDYATAGGITFPDYFFDKVYCTTKRTGTLFDVQACNHEVMHGIDFYMKQKIPTKTYYGFQEVPTYTIDYLFIDYLETLGINKEEVQKLRLKKDAYLVSLAKLVTMQIQNELIRKKGLMSIKYHTIEDVMEVLNSDIIKNLLEVQSGIIAYGLHNQICDNNQIGLEHLKLFMMNYLPKDKRPNFENIGLSDDKLLELSQMIGTYSMMNGEVSRKNR